MDNEVKQALKNLLTDPKLSSARRLEEVLNAQNYRKKLFGRTNQIASIDAASESDRGITERLANSFDASLKAARQDAGLSSSRELTPRECARRFLSPDPTKCEWSPQRQIDAFNMPYVKIWCEDSSVRIRHRTYSPEDGLATVLVGDYGTGIDREKMQDTILALNSAAKLQEFEAIGQFGHGGSSALSFCESTLIITQPRNGCSQDEAYWTLVVTELEPADSKQKYVRRWFVDAQELPIPLRVSDFPELQGRLPGTMVWHFGYQRGGWMKEIRQANPNNPYGRLGRMLFSYPLPFKIEGELARHGTTDSSRTVKAPFYRLLDRWNRQQAAQQGHEQDNSDDDGGVEYYSAEKSESLIVDGVSYGKFSVYAFVLGKKSAVQSYVQPNHPVILTLSGQNHGEMTCNVLLDANLPELATTSIIEVRLDQLDPEALSGIISNSRENPKSSIFTKTLKETLIDLLKSDESLRALEQRRQMVKARTMSSRINDTMTKFLSSILSDAAAQPTLGAGGNAPGETPTRTGPTSAEDTGGVQEIPGNDPPEILEFVDGSIVVPEGTKVRAKFRSDARPPKYTFHGDDRRVFVSFQALDDAVRHCEIAGMSDISGLGYGHISLYCPENAASPISSQTEVGKVTVKLQRRDGGELITTVPVFADSKPAVQRRRRQAGVRPDIRFYVPDGADMDAYKTLLVEEEIWPLSASNMLDRCATALQIGIEETSYWAEKSDANGEDVLRVDINGANTLLAGLLRLCSNHTERAALKDRYVRDIVLDCYQHAYNLDELPESVIELRREPAEDIFRAAEIYLNHDKAVRMARAERSRSAVAATPENSHKGRAM